MLGWLVSIALLLVLWWVFRVNLKQRTSLADAILMLYLDSDVYDKQKEAFRHWLTDYQGPLEKTALWVNANDAVENMAHNFANDGPLSLGVAEILWETVGSSRGTTE